MECPHIEKSSRTNWFLKITNEKNKKPTTSDGNADVNSGSSDCWLCSVCMSSKSPWICLHCGVVHCGRYVNGHAKTHYEGEKEHAVCMDCTTYSAFCYVCDEFVINDTSTKLLAQLRAKLQTINDESILASVDVISRQRTNSGGSSNENRLRRRTNSGDSANEIRLRRRTNSGDSANENRLRKRRKVNERKGGNGKLRVVGLRNLGNTCFMNAVLQSLSNIQQFCCYFKQLPALDTKMVKNGRNLHQTKNKEKDEILMAEELRKTLIALWQGNKSAISPEALFSVVWKIVPRFRGYQQQDAHEFLRYVLDRLHTELLNILPYPHSNSPFIGPKGKSTIVTTIFGGMLQNEVNCLVCGTESKKHDPFLDLSLDIPLQFHLKNTKCKDEEEQTVCKLADCLQSFTELEELAETELYYCSNCKTKQRSTKKFWIRRLPNVLCLHLKRFRWHNYYRTKVDNYVEFPIRNLDMSKFILTNMHETRGSCTGSNLYDLAAVIVHHGTGAGSGHYTAYATHESHWYHFNDSNVTHTEEVSVAKCKAYILFYIRRELKLPNVSAR